MRTKTSQPCVYVLGHSEGSVMVTSASVDNASVCGLILVSGVGRPLGDILREQLKANPANKPILKEALAAIEKLEQGQRVDSTKLHRALQPLFYSTVQDFLISMMQTDPAALAQKADKRTLIIQGANDLQVSVLDAKKLAEATNGKLVIIDGVNHILKDAPASRRKNLATYTNPDLPVSKRVIEAIRDFVHQ
ncbi:MAG: lysophospholipase [Robiginitomaculum sp.]|nr:lysophospholipase [Robiginitomaculum sp.]